MKILASKRRQFIQRLLTTSATVPFLSYMPSVGAQSSARKRFIIMFSPNGTIPTEHFPSGGETNFTLKRILQPLEPIRDELLIFRGLENKIGQPGDGHQRGMGGLWTAAHLTEGDTKGGAANARPVDWAGGISIDQAVANHISQGMRYRSLEYGVRCGNPNVWTRMCYTAADRPIEPEESPYAAFDRLYSDFNNNNTNLNAQEERAVRLGSVLDSVVADFNRVRPFLSADDRAKLEQHAQSVRDIEQSLQQPDLTGTCTVPTMGNQIAINRDENIPALGKLFTDLMVSAFACDQTAVASMQWTRSVGQATYPHLNITRRHHDMSHDADSVSATQENLIRINRWYAEQFLYLVQQLQATPDPSGNGNLLDNTMVLWGNELGKGNNHTRQNIPFVSAGSCQGYFRTGRFIDSPRVSHARLFTSILNAYGINANGFGDYNEGQLANLT